MNALTLITSAPTITLRDGIPTTISTDVAEFFHKQHKNVLRDIENLRQQVPHNHLLNFEQMVVDRPNPSGGAPIKSPAYRLTRDGFTLLAMGFTGKKALTFKLAYIDAFNKMEAALRQPAQPKLPNVKPIVDGLKTAIAEAVREAIPVPPIKPPMWERPKLVLQRPPHQDRDGEPRTIQTARKIVRVLQIWARNELPYHPGETVYECLDDLDGLLATCWTEVSEALFNMSGAMHCMSNATRYLKRWQGHSERVSNVS